MIFDVYNLPFAVMLFIGLSTFFNIAWMVAYAIWGKLLGANKLLYFNFEKISKIDIITDLMNPFFLLHTIECDLFGTNNKKEGDE